RLQLRERFRQDLLVLCLHSDSGGEFSSDLLRDFFCGEGILQSFTLPDSPKQNGIAERCIGLVMEVARTSMIHADAPHFLWPFAVRYAAYQLNLWPRVSLPATSLTLRWTGKVGDASMFHVWGSRAFVRDTSADKISARAIPCVFLGFYPDAPSWQFYHPTSCRVLPSHDVTFDKSVPFYRLFPYRSAPPPPPLLSLAPGPPPVYPLPSQGPTPLGVSQLDPLPGTALVEVAVGSGAARGATSGGAASGGAELGGAESKGAGFGGAEPGGAEPGSAEPEGVEPKGAESKGAEYGDAEPRGTASSGARARDVGAGAGGTGAGGAGAGGGGPLDTGGGGARGTVRPRPYFVPLLRRFLVSRLLLCPLPDQSQPPLQPASPLPATSPYTEQTGGLTEPCEPASRLASTVRTGRRVPCLCPPPFPGTHAMALLPSSVPLRVHLLPPPEFSLPAVPELESNGARAASPTVSRLLSTVVTDPLSTLLRLPSLLSWLT
ncbi:unnamed protein product, partial [Closterium sp. NIES-54]